MVVLEQSRLFIVCTVLCLCSLVFLVAGYINISGCSQGESAVIPEAAVSPEATSSPPTLHEVRGPSPYVQVEVRDCDFYAYVQTEKGIVCVKVMYVYVFGGGSEVYTVFFGYTVEGYFGMWDSRDCRLHRSNLTPKEFF